MKGLSLPLARAFERYGGRERRFRCDSINSGGSKAPVLHLSS
jgi:hypothetical protein